MAVTTKLSLAEAVQKVQQLGMKAPAVLRAIARDAYMVAVREGEQNINGGVLARTGPNAALARYWTATMSFSATVDENGIRGGLPASDLNARILAHRETGGTIRPKTKTFLRIPTDKALTPAGFDRFAGIDLKARIGKANNPFVFVQSLNGQPLLARVIGEGRKSRIEIWYILKRQVTQKPHPWFSNAVKSLQAALPGIVARRMPELGA